MRLIKEIRIPDFVYRIQVSKARRIKYYEVGSKVPKKYLNPKKYAYKPYKLSGGRTVQRLTDLSTNEPVIANPRVAGKPRYRIIRGNDFYSGFAKPAIRNNMMNAIKAELESHFVMAPFNALDYPLYIEFIYMDTKVQAQDLDNFRFAYEKAVLDLLQKKGVLANDNVNYITKLSSEFVEVPEDQRLLVVRFHSINN